MHGCSTTGPTPDSPPPSCSSLCSRYATGQPRVAKGEDAFLRLSAPMCSAFVLLQIWHVQRESSHRIPWLLSDHLHSLLVLLARWRLQSLCWGGMGSGAQYDQPTQSTDYTTLLSPSRPPGSKAPSFADLLAQHQHQEHASDPASSPSSSSYSPGPPLSSSSANPSPSSIPPPSSASSSSSAFLASAYSSIMSPGDMAAPVGETDNRGRTRGAPLPSAAFSTPGPPKPAGPTGLNAGVPSVSKGGPGTKREWSTEGEASGRHSAQANCTGLVYRHTAQACCTHTAYRRHLPLAPCDASFTFQRNREYCVLVST